MQSLTLRERYGAVSLTPAGVFAGIHLVRLACPTLGRWAGKWYLAGETSITPRLISAPSTASSSSRAHNDSLQISARLYRPRLTGEGIFIFRPDCKLNSYAKTGQFRWSFFGDIQPPTNALSAPDIGRDGNIYIIRNLGELYSLTPTPSVRFVVPCLLPQGPVPGPIVSPTGDLVLAGGQATYGQPGLIQAFSTADGALLFEINIPKEPDGTCAVPYARARFTRTGDRAYIPAAQLCVAHGNIIPGFMQSISPPNSEKSIFDREIISQTTQMKNTIPSLIGLFSLDFLASGAFAQFAPVIPSRFMTGDSAISLAPEIS